MRNGFTLIELSIVLVIIGLIIGGILGGKDLIRIALIRKTVSDITSVNTSVHTFKTKYNGLPGDLSKATDFWPGAKNGNGDELIDGYMEALNTFPHLSAAKLTPYNFAHVLVNPGDYYDAMSDEAIFEQQKNLYNLRLAINTNLSIGYSSTFTDPSAPSNAAHFLALGKFTMIVQRVDIAIIYGAWYPEANFGIYPRDARLIDSKMDDGLPWTGTVRNWVNLAGEGGDPTVNCAQGTNFYNEAGVAESCYVLIRMQ